MPLPYQIRVSSFGRLADNSFDIDVEFLDREAEVLLMKEWVPLRVLEISTTG